MKRSNFPTHTLTVLISLPLASCLLGTGIVYQQLWGALLIGNTLAVCTMFILLGDTLYHQWPFSTVTGLGFSSRHEGIGYVVSALCLTGISVWVAFTDGPNHVLVHIRNHSNLHL